jgi:hypothetical protein
MSKCYLVRQEGQIYILLAPRKPLVYDENVSEHDSEYEALAAGLAYKHFYRKNKKKK